MAQTKQKKGRIIKVAGPLIVAEGLDDCRMFDVVRVSSRNLIGEVIEMRGGRASVQVYEETGGLGPGEEVVSTGAPLSVELGPGLLEGIYDGIQRPLRKLMEASGERIGRGIDMPALDHEKKWKFVPVMKKGAQASAGDVIGTVRENSLVEHRIMVPPGVSGTIKSIEEGEFTVDQTVCVLAGDKGEVKLTMMQKWPVRIGRPYKSKMSPSMPLISGQRVIDTFFPVAKGGGERGNEMTDVLNEFPQLTDPRSGEPLMKRTVLIANTSDMPVAAREASIYTGITIAEYFRDMGYNVAIMADSSSRWAEALREMSGRLEEMPGEEGYPAYLSSRLASYYERAGVVRTLGTDNRVGSVTAISAVSPPGGDLSEPVSQATLRIVKVFWGLSASLAYKRHFPAIDWIASYSLYGDRMTEWYDNNVNSKWVEQRSRAMSILQEEAGLNEIVRLVGMDALSAEDRLTMETAKSIREDYLHQDAFNEVDTYASLQKQFRMLKLILDCHTLSADALAKGADLDDLLAIKSREQIGRCKYIPEKQSNKFAEIDALMRQEIEALVNA